MVEPPVIPSFRIPDAMPIPVPILEMPEAQMPYIKPMYVPGKVKPSQVTPGELGDDQGGSSKSSKEETQSLPPLPIQIPEQNTKDEETLEIEGINQVDLWGLTVPVPKPEIMVAAGATATASVAATLSATWAMKRLASVLKPALKQVVKRVQKLRKKEVPTWARERLAQRHYRRLHKVN